MVSSSNSKALAPVEFGRYNYHYEGPSRICFCGLKAPRIMSWSEKNLGWRFLDAHDMILWAKEVILWLYNSKRELENDLDDVRERIRALKDVVKCREENGEKHIEALEKKVDDLQMMVTLTMVYATKQEKWKKCGKLCLVLTVFLAFVLAFFQFSTWVKGVARKRDLKSVGA
ncbi:hypothetical protein SLEP1_g9012 [Rubroshorea leprosula]|uniref:Uncharacterized protein n=1 Tax=Rubroshorea leprosula TaxID=152421 RepID=A0AAV5ICR4_9ROSI|nr:hypothetical protein SLEP1_g9012 [Rubroshorea leprosula]